MSQINRRSIELACTRLRREKEQVTENLGQFQALCTDDIQPKEADTWLLESQAVVDEIVCRAVECEEDRIESGGPEFDVLIAPKERKQIGHAGNTKIWFYQRS